MFPLQGDAASKRCGGTPKREVESTATMYYNYTTLLPSLPTFF